MMTIDEAIEQHKNTVYCDDDGYAKIVGMALEKQKPMKVKSHDETVCPRCNSKWNYGHPYTGYCCHCGQRIGWGEDEE